MLSFQKLLEKILTEQGPDPMAAGAAATPPPAAPADPMLGGGAPAAPGAADPLGGMGGGGMGGQQPPPQQYTFKTEKGAWATLKDWAKQAEEKEMKTGKHQYSWGNPKANKPDKEAQNFKPKSLRT